MIPTRPQGINTNGRVDQLEDRYLGMVEAPSSNLGTSTHFHPIIPLVCYIGVGSGTNWGWNER